MLAIARASPPPNDDPFVFPKCTTRRHADELHAHLLTSGVLLHPSTTSRLIFHLCSSPSPPLHLLANRLLPLHPNVDPFLYNALIKASSNGSNPLNALLAFSLLLSSGVSPDPFSFSLSLTAAARASSLSAGSQLHALILKTGLSLNLYLQNVLISFYSKCGLYMAARQLFDRMPVRDSVSWNSMLDAYVRSGKLSSALELFYAMDDDEKNLISWNSMIGGCARSFNGIGIARQLFDQMPAHDSVSWNLMIDGYIKQGMIDEALELFDKMPKRDVIAWASVINGYMDAGNVELGRRLFDEMPERDVIAWNIMITGYAKNGMLNEALLIFIKMQVEGRIVPDDTTLVTALSAISELGRISLGTRIHKYIRMKRLSMSGKLGVALIDMYSKCGCLEEALQVFETSGMQTVDHWNAMIGGLAMHGFGELSLELFAEMKRRSLKPDDITFIGVLNACSHSGLVEVGLACFKSMIKDYKLEPKVQHYGCMVDILGRAGLLEEAVRLIEGMRVQPNDVVWRSLLSACRNHGNIEIGQKVVTSMTECDKCRSSSYVLLSNLYAGCGMWGDATRIRMMMKDEDFRKIPGCSWIELDGIVHEFVVGDNSHPQAQQIYSILLNLCTVEVNIS
ncbi:TPR-like protein [Dioscorea alata]|uniref:TPR-like protein n=1 Tax=Dioscorea alata TaxID=55571 RepID=A0ACB7V4D1_DIOAL|nr:TPR-like protein [Dioscorea alata]